MAKQSLNRLYVLAFVDEEGREVVAEVVQRPSGSIDVSWLLFGFSSGHTAPPLLTLYFPRNTRMVRGFYGGNKK
jgi:hypothetical protein